jgi:hypothetical protein
MGIDFVGDTVLHMDFGKVDISGITKQRKWKELPYKIRRTGYADVSLQPETRKGVKVFCTQ